MRKISLTAALVAATLSTAAMAADWVFMGMGQGRTVYIDRESIRSMPDGNKRAWFWHVYAEPDEFGTTSAQGLMEFDCKEGRIRSLQINFLKGEEVAARDNNISEWDYVAPDSRGETQLNFLCFGKLD